MNWHRSFVGLLILAGLAAALLGYGVVGVVLLIFGAAGLVDVNARARRSARR
jgi:hypothetical protein